MISVPDLKISSVSKIVPYLCLSRSYLPLQLAAEYGVSFMETSAKANINVEDAFTKIARDIKKKMDTKVSSHVWATNSAVR